MVLFCPMATMMIHNFPKFLKKLIIRSTVLSLVIFKELSLFLSLLS